METVQLRPLCHELGFSSARIEQWISRGYLRLRHETARGHARQVDKTDALRLLVMTELVDAGFDASHIRYALRHLHGWKDDVAYLVISTGRLGRIIPTSEPGDPVPTDEECTPVHVRGHLYPDVVRGRELPGILADENRHVTVVVNLDALMSRVNTAWAEIAKSSDS